MRLGGVFQASELVVHPLLPQPISHFACQGCTGRIDASTSRKNKFGPFKPNLAPLWHTFYPCIDCKLFSVLPSSPGPKQKGEKLNELLFPPLDCGQRQQDFIAIFWCFGFNVVGWSCKQCEQSENGETGIKLSGFCFEKQS